VKALILTGVDANRRIIGTNAPAPFLLNVPIEYIERFRKQLSLVDLEFRADPSIVEGAVRACCQEKPSIFCGYSLYDTGSYPAAPFSGVITWRVPQPWTEPTDEEEITARKKVEELKERLKRRGKQA